MAVNVLLNDVLVGALGAASHGRIGFRFFESYRTMRKRPVLGQRFEDDLERTYTGRRPGQLPAFFAHLLPEGRLRDVVQTSLSLDGESDLELLGALADDLPGAVRLADADLNGFPTDSQRSLRNGNGNGDTELDASTEASELGFRFSLAGAQMKFSVLRCAQRFTVPARGKAGEWIVKLSLESFHGLAENEFATLSWARAIGFDVPNCMLVNTQDLRRLAKYAPPQSSALAVARYDRDGQRRIHQEDMAQVLQWQPQPGALERYSTSYEVLLALIRAIVGDEAFWEANRRLAFVIASGNNDAHLKNWSLVYADAITPSLAPLYDQVATVAWPRLDRKLALKFASVRDFGRVDFEAVKRLARRAGADEERTVAEFEQTIVLARKTWADGALKELPSGHAERIRAHWQAVPLLRAFGPLR